LKQKRKVVSLENIHRITGQDFPGIVDPQALARESKQVNLHSNLKTTRSGKREEEEEDVSY
jgi:hypothetical protein